MFSKFVQGVALTLVVAVWWPQTACAGQHDKRAESVEQRETAAMLDDLSKRTFQFFWDTSNPANGLAPDRYPGIPPASLDRSVMKHLLGAPQPASSIAAVGFALTAYPIGVERGYITRAQARTRTLTTLRFFYNAPQGDAKSGVSGYKGFFYHFLDMKTGLRTYKSELSTIDTALLLGGVLCAQSYFDGKNAEEVEIRRLADEIYRRVDWRWAQVRPPRVVLGWSPEDGPLKYDWVGYNEAMLLYVLALGSPTHGLEPQTWAAWTEGYAKHWTKEYGQEYLSFPPQFGHQYSEVWIDFRGIQDDFMRGKGIDYFENSRRASYAQQAYAEANPIQCAGYGATLWGVTASDGPADKTVEEDGIKRHFYAYAGRGMGGAAHHDDCTMAPTGAAASIAFAPEIAIPAIADMEQRYGKQIYGKYGFLDAFNLTFHTDVRLAYGRLEPGFGWVDTDYLGIDQGPILAMLQNYRDGMIWRIMRKNPYVKAGLEKAGFRGGWLDHEK